MAPFSKCGCAAWRMDKSVAVKMLAEMLAELEIQGGDFF
jgi:hypothetical protein